MRTMTTSVVGSILLGGFTVAAAQLPPEVMADRYLVQVERLIAENDYEAALDTMNEIVALQSEHPNLTLPDVFHFKYAQVALGAGSSEAAIDSVTKYLATAGRDGEFYREALELLDAAEHPEAAVSLEESADFINTRLAECGWLPQSISVSSDYMRISGFNFTPSYNNEAAFGDPKGHVSFGTNGGGAHVVRVKLGDLSTIVESRPFFGDGGIMKARGWKSISTYGEMLKYRVTVRCARPGCIKIVKSESDLRSAQPSRRSRAYGKIVLFLFPELTDTEYGFFLCGDDAAADAEVAARVRRALVHMIKISGGQDDPF